MGEDEELGGEGEELEFRCVRLRGAKNRISFSLHGELIRSKTHLFCEPLCARTHGVRPDRLEQPLGRKLPNEPIDIRARHGSLDLPSLKQNDQSANDASPRGRRRELPRAKEGAKDEDGLGDGDVCVVGSARERVEGRRGERTVLGLRELDEGLEALWCNGRNALSADPNRGDGVRGERVFDVLDVDLLSRIGSCSTSEMGEDARGTR